MYYISLKDYFATKTLDFVDAYVEINILKTPEFECFLNNFFVIEKKTHT